MGIFSDKSIRALSWKQPFATAMLHGKVETRTWNTSYRGLVLICASKTEYSFADLDKIVGSNRLFTALMHFPAGRDLMGQAIAVGRLVDCRPMTKEDEDQCFVSYRPELFCHVYKDVQAIVPFPWKGCQGWKVVCLKSLIQSP